MCWVCATCRLYVCTVCAQRVCVCVRYCNLYEPCICVVTSLVFLPLRASYYPMDPPQCYEPRRVQFTSLVYCYEPRKVLRASYTTRSAYTSRLRGSYVQQCGSCVLSHPGVPKTMEPCPLCTMHTLDYAYSTYARVHAQAHGFVVLYCTNRSIIIRIENAL